MIHVYDWCKSVLDNVSKIGSLQQFPVTLQTIANNDWQLTIEARTICTCMVSFYCTVR